MATSMSRRNISSSANNYQKCKPLSNLDKKRTNQQLRNKEKKRTMMAWWATSLRTKSQLRNLTLESCWKDRKRWESTPNIPSFSMKSSILPTSNHSSSLVLRLSYTLKPLTSTSEKDSTSRPFSTTWRPSNSQSPSLQSLSFTTTSTLHKYSNPQAGTSFLYLSTTRPKVTS